MSYTNGSARLEVVHWHALCALCAWSGPLRTSCQAADRDRIVHDDCCHGEPLKAPTPPADVEQRLAKWREETARRLPRGTLPAMHEPRATPETEELRTAARTDMDVPELALADGWERAFGAADTALHQLRSLWPHRRPSLDPSAQQAISDALAHATHLWLLLDQMADSIYGSDYDAARQRGGT